MTSKEDLSVHEEWIDQVCDALGVDRADLDVDAVLSLAGRVAHRVARPMAPVSTFLLGLAIGSGRGTPEQLRERILAAGATPDAE